MYKSLIRPLLFKCDPEKIHYFTFRMLRNSFKIPGVPALMKKKFCVEDPRLEREVFGLKFKNPVGLAAGMD
ncbi:MAG: dihydroorotate dehydrogenase (quinone), partial [Salegentibacter sp.]